MLEVHGAVATSGSYERGAHLVDPLTGRAACRAASATVTGPSLAMADALATALAVGGDAALAAVARLPGYAGYLIRPDGTETWTSGIQFAAPDPALGGTLAQGLAEGSRETAEPAHPARNDRRAHMVGAGDKAAPRTRRRSNAGANTYDGPE